MSRLLKPVLVTITCLAIGFAILSFVYRDGVTHQTSVIIEADPSAVWEIFTNTEDMPKWMYGLSEIEILEGRYGEEDAVVDFVYRNEKGEKSKIRERITKIVEPDRFDFAGENEQFLMTGSVVFQEVSEGTLVTQDLTHKGKTLYWKAIAPMMETVFKTSSEGLYANLKRYVESNTPVNEK